MFSLITPQVIPLAHATMNTSIQLGYLDQYSLQFVADKRIDADHFQVDGPDTINKNVVEYVGSEYKIDAWIRRDSGENDANCVSSIVLTLTMGDYALSPAMPILYEDGAGIRDYSLVMDAVGTYTANLRGSLNCKWYSDGHQINYPIDVSYTLAKVIQKVAPNPIKISSLKCPKPFKISTIFNSTNKCELVLIDADHVADKLSLWFPNFWGAGITQSLGKSWKKTKTGWTVSLTVPISMVTPAAANNLTRVLNTFAMVSVDDSKIMKGEKFTEVAQPSFKSFPVTFIK